MPRMSRHSSHWPHSLVPASRGRSSSQPLEPQTAGLFCSKAAAPFSQNSYCQPLEDRGLQAQLIAELRDGILVQQIPRWPSITHLASCPIPVPPAISPDEATFFTRVTVLAIRLRNAK